MNRDDPLSPEERALAGLIGRRHDQAPPAALDAAILAAARASVATPAAATPAAADTGTPSAARARRPQRRWPAVFGIAASMVFAVGIAWQMRPEPPSLPAQATQHAAAPSTDEAAAADTQAPQPMSAAADSAPPPPPAPVPSPKAAPAAPTQAARSAVAHAPEVRAAPAAAEPAPPVELRSLPAEPAAEAAFAPAPPAPPAPIAPTRAPVASPAPAAPAAELDAIQGAAAASDEAARSQRRAPPAAFKANAAAPTSAPGVMLRRSNEAALSADAVHSEVAADARLPRRQWLQKIRERRDSGQRDLARASLERYLQLYPESRLPRDLRPLLDD
ncbi:hypothetical protein C1924_08205 [Stenotrophomonas sp. ESTM1D_MKCIP4_1]|uniref:hypothetical protein n=1 Tax=Stenotrophomonas sp. ESTM1D_MKCIP4_1 TaxID=2072414 RepID=UPI000D5429EC|nr:hypothetical protein [Stenotrophomonas sp. ESTM1D_MKCIP4_1]AWH53161.1 hypothetical protein C1924_08205 [Stenotrophomonas sp. ESTM1D_MKCIP4_1]